MQVSQFKHTLMFCVTTCGPTPQNTERPQVTGIEPATFLLRGYSANHDAMCLDSAWFLPGLCQRFRQTGSQI